MYPTRRGPRSMSHCSILRPSAAAPDRPFGTSSCLPCAVLYTRYYVLHDTEYTTGMSVSHALLALLSEGPKYGLRLREEFEARTGDVWPCPAREHSR